MDEVEYTKLELKPLSEKAILLGMHALNCEMEADGTRYSLLVIPFVGYIGCGFISQNDAYLVVDGGEKTAYVFKSDPHWSYVWEKLIRGYRAGLGTTDAKNTAYLIEKAVEKIVAEAQAELAPEIEDDERKNKDEADQEAMEDRLRGEAKAQAEAEAREQEERAREEEQAQEEEQGDEDEE